MFSAGFSNKSMVIKTNNVNRINLKNIEKIRGLIIRALRNPSDKLILDIDGVKFIDSKSFATLNDLIAIAKKHNTEFAFTNVDPEVKELFDLFPEKDDYKIDTLSESPEYKEIEALV